MTAESGARADALVLAGSRGPDDAVAAAAGVSCKALAPVAGRPMLQRVLDALAASGCVRRVTVALAPEVPVADEAPALARAFAAGEIARMDPESSPCRTVRSAFAARDATRPLLVATGDHPLLTGEMVRAFIAGSQLSRADVTAGVTPVGVVDAAFPGVRRTALKFRDGGYSGCNLFALMTPRANDVLALWQTLENDRKRPWRMAAHLGSGTLFAYMTRRLTLDGAVARVGMRAGADLAAVRLNWASAARDVDTPGDLELAEAVLRGDYAAAGASGSAAAGRNAARAGS